MNPAGAETRSFIIWPDSPKILEPTKLWRIVSGLDLSGDGAFEVLAVYSDGPTATYVLGILDGGKLLPGERILWEWLD